MKKVFLISRGMPGLGRVVGSYEFARYLHEKFNCDLKFFSYYQGYEYLSTAEPNQEIITIDNTQDISAMGLVPLSCSGDKLFDIINEWDPDILLVDGEPLFTLVHQMYYSNRIVVSFANPSDLKNSSIRPHSEYFFNKTLELSNYTICHSHNENYRWINSKIVYMPTIIRKSILNITHRAGKKILVLLGGGSVGTNDNFLKSTQKIALYSLDIARSFPDYLIEIQTSNEEIKLDLEKALEGNLENIKIYSNLRTASELYQHCALVIARAGRNTISELLYLNIPAVLIATSYNYRSSEQLRNISEACVISKIIRNFELESGSEKLINLCNELLDSYLPSSFWRPGNDYLSEIVERIIE